MGVVRRLPSGLGPIFASALLRIFCSAIFTASVKFAWVLLSSASHVTVRNFLGLLLLMAPMRALHL